MNSPIVRHATVDALAVALGGVAAVVFRAAVRPHDPLSLDNLGPTLAVGVPLAVLAALATFAAAGRYRSPADHRSSRLIAADLAVAASIVSFVAFARSGVDAPLLTMLTGYAFCAITVMMSQRLTGTGSRPARLS